MTREVAIDVVVGKLDGDLAPDEPPVRELESALLVLGVSREEFAASRDRLFVA